MLAAVLAAPFARAATSAPALDGAKLAIAWAIPFGGLLLSIALLPLIAPRFWHRRYGWIAAGWAAALLVPVAAVFGPAVALHEVLHALLLDYVPFVALIGGLFVISGGIRLTGDFRGTPFGNTLLLAFGTAMASVVGTTGAAMLLIRPLIRANAERGRKTHVFVFFVLLVANIGGALSPLGDPPLFLGFIKGVEFFWPTRHLLAPTLILAGALLGAFYALDRIMIARETMRPSDHGPSSGFGFDGGRNLFYLAGAIGAVLLSGVWRPGPAFEVAGVAVEIQNLVRDGLLVTLAWASLRTTPPAIRAANGFSWEPLREVALLFVGIFLTIVPVIDILNAGEDGELARLIGWLEDENGRPSPNRYFWTTGLLSAVLDNAPTYLVFFNVAGGDPATLQGEGAAVLRAISAGAVYFGALSYVGNAPNFMVKAVAENAGIRMPSFFGYVAWATLLLLPVLIALDVFGMI